MGCARRSMECWSRGLFVDAGRDASLACMRTYPAKNTDAVMGNARDEEVATLIEVRHIERIPPQPVRGEPARHQRFPGPRGARPCLLTTPADYVASLGYFSALHRGWTVALNSHPRKTWRKSLTRSPAGARTLRITIRKPRRQGHVRRGRRVLGTKVRKPWRLLVMMRTCLPAHRLWARPRGSASTEDKTSEMGGPRLRRPS